MTNESMVGCFPGRYCSPSHLRPEHEFECASHRLHAFAVVSIAGPLAHAQLGVQAVNDPGLGCAWSGLDTVAEK